MADKRIEQFDEKVIVSGNDSVVIADSEDLDALSRQKNKKVLIKNLSVFEEASNVIRLSANPGYDEDFVLGSNQLNYSAIRTKKLIYDGTKSALRIGIATDTRWDTALRGNNSFAAGDGIALNALSHALSGLSGLEDSFSAINTSASTENIYNVDTLSGLSGTLDLYSFDSDLSSSFSATNKLFLRGLDSAVPFTKVITCEGSSFDGTKTTISFAESFDSSNMTSVEIINLSTATTASGAIALGQFALSNNNSASIGYNSRAFGQFSASVNGGNIIGGNNNIAINSSVMHGTYNIGIGDGNGLGGTFYDTESVVFGSRLINLSAENGNISTNFSRGDKLLLLYDDAGVSKSAELIVDSVTFSSPRTIITWVADFSPSTPSSPTINGIILIKSGYSSSRNFVIGTNNINTGLGSFVTGIGNINVGEKSTLFGEYCINESDHTFIGGYKAISGEYADESLSLGNNTYTYSSKSLNIGTNNICGFYQMFVIDSIDAGAGEITLAASEGDVVTEIDGSTFITIRGLDSGADVIQLSLKLVSSTWDSTNTIITVEGDMTNFDTPQYIAIDNDKSKASVTIGDENLAKGGSIAIGDTNIIDSLDSFIIGNENETNGDTNFFYGYKIINSDSYEYSIGFGAESIINHHNSITNGYKDTYLKQFSDVLLMRDTTGAQSLALVSSILSVPEIPEGFAGTFECEIIGTQVGGTTGSNGDSWSYTIKGGVKRDFGGSAALKWGGTTTTNFEDDASCNAVFTVASDQYTFTVTGVANRNIAWTARLKIVECQYETS